MDRIEKFWTNLRKLTIADTSVEVPVSAHNLALAVFPKREGEARSFNIFRLSPASLVLVRKAGQHRKFLYELGDFVVQLEQGERERGCQLSGFVHGIEDGPVVLYGEESIFEATIENGNFLFESVPFGTFRICFCHEGEHFWVRDLRLEAESGS